MEVVESGRCCGEVRRHQILICDNALRIVGNKADDGACDERLELFAQEEKDEA
jgi:hypothetical protein